MGPYNAGIEISTALIHYISQLPPPSLTKVKQHGVVFKPVHDREKYLIPGFSTDASGPGNYLQHPESPFHSHTGRRVDKIIEQLAPGKGHVARQLKRN